MELSLTALDLLARTRILLLKGELAAAEPRKIRYRLLHALDDVDPALASQLRATRPGMTTGTEQDFGCLVRRARARDTIVVQPRMGFSDPALMRSGLAAVAALPVATAGTTSCMCRG